MRLLRILLIGSTLLSANTFANTDFFKVESIERLPISNAIGIPSDDSAWQATTLPFSETGVDDYGRARLGSIWFKKNLTDDFFNVHPQALYIQNHVFDIEIFLNQHRIGGRYRNDGLQAMGWNHPLYIDISPVFWKKSGNVLHVRLGVGEPNAILSPVVFGGEAALRELYEKRTFQQVTIALWSLIACVLMGLFTLSLWWMRRQDSLYLSFAVICFSWSLVMTYLVLPYSPILHRIWLGLGYWAVDIAGFSTFILINRLMSFQHKYLERILFFILLLSGLILLTMNMRYHSLISSITHGIQFIFCFYVLLKTMLIAITHRRQEAIWVATGLTLMLSIMLRDMYVFWQAYQEPKRLPESTMMQYGFGVLLIVVFIYLIRIFVRALNDSESLNKSLEKRVEQATESLDKIYAENRLLEINKSAQKERQKIYRDLHDDVGAKLVSIIHSGVENEQTDLAREALVSLREVVAQNSFQYQDISVLIVSSINEMEKRLRNAGITLYVEGVYALKESPITPGVGYHISRILREVTSNIIKHSQATSVLVECSLDGNMLSIKVQDDGRGMLAESLMGSGIENIQHRAKEINASVDWLGADNGGCVFYLRHSLEFKNQ